jgi:integrase
MPKVPLTDITAKNVRSAPGQRFTLWDTMLPAFGLRVSARTKTWTVMVDRKARRRITIGRYSAMGVQAARAEARRIINTTAAARSQPGITPVTFSAALAKFIELHLPQIRPSTAREYQRVLRKHCETRWRARLLSDIHRSDVTAVLDGLHRTPIMANNTFSTIRLFFRWSLRRGYLLHSPCEAMRAPARWRSRDRVLSRDELRQVLITAGSSGTFGIIVAVLALTAQRRGEVAALHSSWVNRDAMLLTIPKEITKNRHEHQLPLTPIVLHLLPRGRGLLFPARGVEDTAFNGWSKSMETFRKACGVENFRLHDLRRTAATIMAEELDVLPHVIERVLNHITGTISPIGRVYNRAKYMPEMRAALLAYEQYLVHLVRKDGDNQSSPSWFLIDCDHARHGEPWRAQAGQWRPSSHSVRP